MADTQYVVKVTTKVEAFVAGDEEVPCFEHSDSLVMRNMNQAELLAFDGELLKFYFGLLDGLRALAESDGLFLDKD